LAAAEYFQKQRNTPNIYLRAEKSQVNGIHFA